MTGEHPSGEPHHFCVAQFGVGEDHVLDAEFCDHLLEAALGQDRDAVGVLRAGEAGGVAAGASAVCGVGCGEAEDEMVGIGAVQGVEHMEVPAGRADDQGPAGLVHGGHSDLPPVARVYGR